VFVHYPLSESKTHPKEKGDWAKLRNAVSVYVCVSLRLREYSLKDFLHQYMRFKAPTAMSIMITVFWDMTPCSLFRRSLLPTSSRCYLSVKLQTLHRRSPWSSHTAIPVLVRSLVSDYEVERNMCGGEVLYDSQGLMVGWLMNDELERIWKEVAWCTIQAFAWSD
jgi:hypothetical protein